MGTSKDNLIDEIDKLKKELKHAKKYTYIYETTSLHCNDGELYIYYGNKDNCLVFNVEQLYKDLPFIITQVVKEQNKMQKMYLDLIKESIKEI